MAKKKNVTCETGVFDESPVSRENKMYDDIEEYSYSGRYVTKHFVSTFTMPGDEPMMESIMNDKNSVITNKVITPCPKEGIILIYVEYDKQVQDKGE